MVKEKKQSGSHISTLSRNATEFSGVKQKLTKTNKVWSEDTVSVALTSTFKDAATCGDQTGLDANATFQGPGELINTSS